jgi:hypothetical protein
VHLSACAPLYPEIENSTRQAAAMHVLARVIAGIYHFVIAVWRAKENRMLGNAHSRGGVTDDVQLNVY